MNNYIWVSFDSAERSCSMCKTCCFHGCCWVFQWTLHLLSRSGSCSQMEVTPRHINRLGALKLSLLQPNYYYYTSYYYYYTIYVFNQNFQCSLPGNEIFEAAARQPVFTCSWKLLCKFNHTERERENCLCKVIPNTTGHKKWENTRCVTSSPGQHSHSTTSAAPRMSWPETLWASEVQVQLDCFTNRFDATQATWTCYKFLVQLCFSSLQSLCLLLWRNELKISSGWPVTSEWKCLAEYDSLFLPASESCETVNLSASRNVTWSKQLPELCLRAVVSFKCVIFPWTQLQSRWLVENN